MSNLTRSLTKQDVYVEKEETLATSYLKFKKYWLRHLCYSGKMSPVIVRDVICRGLGVAVLPYDPKLNQVVLIEQFRIGAYVSKDAPSAWMIEIIAGMVEPGESPSEVAAREAFEEAGLTISHLKPIYHYWATPGSSSENLQLFYAEVDLKNIKEGIFGLEDEGEDIRMLVVDFEQAWQWLEQGKIVNPHTIIALQWLKLNHFVLKKAKNHDF